MTQKVLNRSYSLTSVYRSKRHFSQRSFLRFLNPCWWRNKLSSEPTLSVAILCPSAYPGIREVKERFMKDLNDSAPERFEFTIYNALGNTKKIRPLAEEIAQEGHDLVFTIGARCTGAMKRVTEGFNSRTPLLFSGVRNPEELGILSHRFTPTAQITGTLACAAQYDERIKILLAVKPQITRVGIIFDPAWPSTTEQKNELCQLLHSKGIKTEIVELSATDEIDEKIQPLIGQIDTLLTLWGDNTTLARMEELARVSTSHHFTLVGAEASAVKDGAAIGIGIEVEHYGSEGAKKAYAILVEKRSPSTIPITQANYPLTVKINPVTMAHQGLEIDPHLLFIINHGSLI